MSAAIHKRRKRTALITGAAKGLGYELGKLYARAGHDLILVDKNSRSLHRVAGQLEKVYSVQVTTVVQDLTDTRSAEHLKETIDAAGRRVDVVVNRAGYRIYGPFSDRELLRELRMVSAAFRMDPAAGVTGPISLAGLFQTATV
ncbi:MAG: SDR family NAD(P)-dependent oxidoreductase [Desulfobacterales bacterium]|nr:SDR family NAD(P)-dependent oxidoreductase [Desulfobacterales bacterium]